MFAVDAWRNLVGEPAEAVLSPSIDSVGSCVDGWRRFLDEESSCINDEEDASNPDDDDECFDLVLCFFLLLLLLFDFCPSGVSSEKRSFIVSLGALMLKVTAVIIERSVLLSCSYHFRFCPAVVTGTTNQSFEAIASLFYTATSY